VNKLRVGVVGAGRLGGFHAQKLSGMDSVELAGVADPVEAQRDRVAAECHTQALADHRQLLAQVDAVVIAAPTRLHHRLGLDALKQGVHVMMEKPLAPTKAEADELVDVAEQAGVVLQVGHVERFNPAFTAVLPSIGAPGSHFAPKYIEAVRASNFTFRSTDVGVVLDLMIHDLDLVLTLVRSKLRKVDALGLSVLGGHEDAANCRLEFECGCVAVLNACRVSYEAARRIHIWTLRSMADVDFAARTTSLVEASDCLLRRQFNVDQLSPEQVEHYKQHLFAEHLPRTQTQYDAVDALSLELQDFVAAIQLQREPRVTGRQGRDAVAVAEQVLAKIQDHAWDCEPQGLAGPLALPRPSIIPAPHWHLAPANAPGLRREAG
jgi:predicted dehydrogenase